MSKLLRVCLLLCTFLTGNAFSYEINPTSITNAIWDYNSFFTIIIPNATYRCSPWTRTDTVYDWTPETLTSNIISSVTVVLGYNRVNNGVLEACTEKEAFAECSNGNAYICRGISLQYDYCTDYALDMHNAPCTWRKGVGSTSNDINDYTSSNPFGLKNKQAQQRNIGKVCGAECGDPIQVGTGNSFQIETDYVDPLGRGFDFKRYYNSLLVYRPSFLGDNWTYSFSKRIIPPPPFENIAAVLVEGLSGYYLQDDDGSTYPIYPNPDSRFKGTFTFISDENGVNTGIMLTYPDGTVERYTKEGVLLKIENAQGGTFTMQYLNNEVKVIDDMGRVMDFQFGNRAVVLPNGATLSYDKNAKTVNLNSQLKSKYTFSDNNLIAKSNSQNTVVSNWTVDNSTGKYSANTWNSGLSKVTISYASDGNSMTATDEFNNTETFNFTLVVDKKMPTTYTKVCASTSNGCVPESSTYTYDSNGNMVEITSTTNKFCIAYDGKHRVLSEIYNLSPTDACASPPGTALFRTYSWDTQLDLLLGYSQPNKKEAYTYDSKHRLIGHTISATSDSTGVQGLSAVSSNTLSESFVYEDTHSNVTQHTSNGKTTTYSYSPSGFLTTKTSASGLTYNYTNFTTDGLPQSITTPSGLIMTVAYDANNNVASVTTDEGEQYTWTYTPDNILTTMTKNGETISITYESSSRVASVQSALGITNYGYTSNVKSPTSVSLSSASLVVQKAMQYTEQNKLKSISR